MGVSCESSSNPTSLKGTTIGIFKRDTRRLEYGSCESWGSAKVSPEPHPGRSHPTGFRGAPD